MPLFEYVCRDCDKAFEAFVTTDRKAECPSCHGANLSKLLSSPGMVSAGASVTAKPRSGEGGCRAQGGRCGCH